ncbi:unnamed protein product [Adineta steineri]|uniref:Uncharacterized protein n=1 Tax=Adineta steineri TaxID=433720 RepID=A0A813MQJ3_9BILA|nr:unnamed protein product [Adineta steineri]CAF1319233.1 unnamed protein product [Adineta steineri]
MIDDEQRFALHTINDPKNLSFDRYAYSRYKYGDSNQAKQFGQELYTGFLDRYRDFLLSSNQQFIAISSPRSTIPPAVYYIFQTFLEKLNRFLQLNKCEPIIEHTIQRIGTIAEDYSLLSRHERLDRLIDERYSIDCQDFGNKFLLFVDDIRITGIHEMNIIRLLKTSNIYNSRLFIYYAQLVNDKIPTSFEYELNRSAISNLEQLLTIIRNPSSSFQINTRVLKEILRSNLSELDYFLQSINTDLMSQLYHACFACNYQTIEIFVDSLEYIHRCLQQRQNEKQAKYL